MNKYFFIFFVFLSFTYTFPQNRIEDDIEILQSELIEQPNNSTISKKLIRKYFENNLFELALLEILDLERNQVSTVAFAEEKAEVLFWMGQNSKAKEELIKLYLTNPDYKNSFYISILDWANNNRQRSKSFLNSLETIDNKLPEKLASTYNTLFINHNESLAKSAAELLNSFDYQSYSKLFPLPQIFVYSPTNNAITQNNYTKVSFDIKHTKQIKKIEINKKQLYQIPNDANIDLNSAFDKQFNFETNLQPGENSIVINVEDVFGYNSSSIIKLYSTFFPINEELTTKDDELNKKILLINELIPESIVEKSKNDHNKIIFISDKKEPSKFHKYFIELISNDLTSFSTKKNIKYIAKKDLTANNLDLIFTKSLIPNISLQTNILLIFDVSNNMVENGNSIRIDSYLSSIQKTAFNSICVITNSKIDLFKYLKESFEKSNLHSTLINLQSNFNYDEFSNFLLNPNYLSQDISKLFNENNSDYFSKREDNFRKFFNPVSGKVKIAFNNLFHKFSENIKKENFKKSQRNQLLQFYGDWQRFNDIKQYLNQKSSSEELLEYMNENKTEEDNK